MSSPIEILNEKIDTDKEILSVMPKNTKKNAELYVKKVTEIKEGYQKYLEEVITEIKRRAHKINSIKESPEIKQVEKELKKRKHSVEKFSNGLRRFIIGLSKKIIIANNMALIADTIFNSAISNNYTGIVLILGTLAYTFQIYFDFSGYCDSCVLVHAPVRRSYP